MRAASMTAPMTFSFLGESRHIGGWEVDAPRLWAYNLHYFDDLNAQDAAARRAWHVEAIQSWIVANPPLTAPGWEPYPTSLRIVNWIKWAMGGAPLDPRAIESLALQVRALEGRLEYHLLGNHLLANAKALTFAGLFFEGKEADAWLARGADILQREMDEQILPDGGHFERSPMYHSIVLEDVADLMNIASAFADAIPSTRRPLAALRPDTLQRMRAWLLAMCHPDGEISFFNDAAIGIAPSPGEVERYARQIAGVASPALPTSRGPVHVVRLPDSGYIRAEAPEAVLLIDVAPLGPDYLLGHAHADTLSFELSLWGERLIVNGGTSVYEPGPVRSAERGTAAHTTVEIDGEDSSEVWAAFRVARRAHPVSLTVDATDDRLEVACSHDGYRWLRGKPVHRRAWSLSPGRLWVEDRVEGAYRSAVARFHLHPQVQISVDAGGEGGMLRLAGGREARWRLASGTARIDECTYSPEFGTRMPAKCLSVDFSASGKSCLEVSW